MKPWYHQPSVGTWLTHRGRMLQVWIDLWVCIIFSMDVMFIQAFPLRGGGLAWKTQMWFLTLRSMFDLGRTWWRKSRRSSRSNQSRLATTERVQNGVLTQTRDLKIHVLSFWKSHHLVPVLYDVPMITFHQFCELDEDIMIQPVSLPRRQDHNAETTTLEVKKRGKRMGKRPYSTHSNISDPSMKGFSSSKIMVMFGWHRFEIS